MEQKVLAGDAHVKVSRSSYVTVGDVDITRAYFDMPDRLAVTALRAAISRDVEIPPEAVIHYLREAVIGQDSFRRPIFGVSIDTTGGLVNCYLCSDNRSARFMVTPQYSPIPQISEVVELAPEGTFFRRIGERILRAVS